MKTLYFSKRITTKPQYQSDWKKIKTILERFKINYDFIEGTKDIWARDYMPVRSGKGELVQFKYEPSYLEDTPHLQTNPEDVLINGERPTNASITYKLDGGNYVKHGNKVIITERLFEENNIKPTTPSKNPREEKIRKVFETPFNSKQQKVIRDLESLLDVEIILIPCYGPDKDLTGHSDGYMRFINEGIVLISQLDKEEKAFAQKMLAAIERYNLEYIEMPSFEYYNPAYKDAAIGCYLNYLELDHLIIFPIFDFKPQLDNDALAVIKKQFPNKHIEPIIINDIAHDGGLMNCISWEG